jgi:hypothetical protein
MVLFVRASRTSSSVFHTSHRITGIETNWRRRMKSLRSNIRRLFVRTVKLLFALGGIRMMGNFCPSSVMTRISPSLPSLEPRCFARLYANSVVSLLQRGIKWGASEKDYRHLRVWRWVESFCGKLNGSVNPRPAAASPSPVGCKILQRAWRVVLQWSPIVSVGFKGPRGLHETESTDFTQDICFSRIKKRWCVFLVIIRHKRTASVA